MAMRAATWEADAGALVLSACFSVSGFTLVLWSAAGEVLRRWRACCPLPCICLIALALACL